MTRRTNEEVMGMRNALEERFPGLDYISFGHEGHEVEIDGYFTSEQLRAIADMLDNGLTKGD